MFRKRPDSAVSSRMRSDSPVLNPNMIRFVLSTWQKLTESYNCCHIRDDRDTVGTQSYQFRDDAVRIRQDLDIIGTQSTRNGIVLFFPNHARSSRQGTDSVPTTQDSVTILIRHSRICHDSVTIVIRLDTIG